MQSVSDLYHIVDRIKFKEEGWRICIGFDGDSAASLQPYLQIVAVTRDNVTERLGHAWSGRKWRLSHHMTDGEVVQTAFMAVMAAVERETREKFTYRGVSIFDPHYDIERLVELRRDPTSIKERE